MKKTRFYIDTKGNDDQAYYEAIKFACRISEEDGTIARVTILIQSKQQNSWFERLYGKDVVKKLSEGVKFNECKPIFKFETIKTYKDYSKASEIVITCGLNVEDVLKIDDYYSVKSIIAIPWFEDGLKKWVNTWNPTEIRRNQKPLVEFTLPSCIVIKALEDLTGSINMSTGIQHTSDENKAKTYILALHKYESSIDSDIVGSYLVRELGWMTEHAKEIEKLIDTLNNGKHFQGGYRTGLKDYYEKWKEKCK